MLYAILGFFSLVESIVGVALMTASTMKFREPVKKRILIGFIMMLFGISLLFLTLFLWGINAVDGSAILFILGIILAWFYICSGDTFFVSVFNFLTFLNIYVSISYISEKLALSIGGNSHIAEYILIRALIYGIVVALLFKFVRPRFRRLVVTLDKEWRAATLVPLLFLILQIFLLYYPVPYWVWESNNWNKFVVIIVYVLFLSVYYLLYIQASAIVEKYDLESRHLLMAQQEKLWEAELARQMAAVSLASQQRHDMHHHNALIMDMLTNNKWSELGAYMERFDAAIDLSKSTDYCKNPIINSICNVYTKKAATAQIQIHFNLLVPEQTGIDHVDLTCIFGNILENAIEGCLRLMDDTKREISVSAKYMDDRLRIQVENSCCDDIAFDGELPKTQKQGGGTGIHSIIYTAEQYDGTSGFSVNDGKFYTHIVLNAQRAKNRQLPLE